ncbi:MAG: prepilin-type N-terminal cleavage/methylation domain-containing protein [Halochromatium sp.]|uniref:prepilin-type N-terminal cleavage/methylation domain-containing protein n=1 Tax=Halochromatium sp. TaxID=2049430 RepID=UPI00397D5555
MNRHARPGIRRSQRWPGRQSGLSLVEVMIGLTVGLLIMLSALTLYTVNLRYAVDLLGAARLNAELRAAMDMMVTDIRRAGFGGQAFTEPHFSDLELYEDGSCLVFTYDANQDGVLRQKADDASGSYELFGFKVDDHLLKVRQGGGDLSACNSGGQWHGLTDPATVRIAREGPVFSLDVQCLRTDTGERAEGQRCRPGFALYEAASAEAAGTDVDTGPLPIRLVEIRLVHIDLEGSLTRDPTIRARRSQAVLVRNHRVVNLPISASD